MFTQKHYRMLATCVASMLTPKRDKRYVAEALASMLQKDNERFNPLMWHVACGTVNDDDYAAQK